MKKFIKYSFLLLLLAWTWILNTYHAGVFPKPKVSLETPVSEAFWFERREHGLNHLVLFGEPFPRGRRAGEFTSHLLAQQEEQLITKLKSILPSPILIQAMVLGAITWFQGIDQYLEPAWVEEMYGTALTSSKKFDYLADGFTRQIAYHGLHEVGQMMVDQGAQDMGCTVVGLPLAKSWLIGRNFDFEGGRTFDSEKIVKWTFPKTGHAFVSVVFSGMVGTVTGINEQGLYISLNAAGSDDLRRLGSPSTLLITKALQEASTSEEAIALLRNAQMFITDIFVILDASGKLYRVEKSPARFAVREETGPTAIANHLITQEFENDQANRRRMLELTTVARETRARELIQRLNPKDGNIEEKVLAILRDKGVDDRGQPLHLGNRRAIDSLIAAHSIVYNAETGVLFVSQGPAVAGPFLGYNLAKSFAAKRPIPAGSLPRDPVVSDLLFSRMKEAAHDIADAHRLVRNQRCQAGRMGLDAIEPELRQQGPYFHALGDAHQCAGEVEKARSAWGRALEMVPAYTKDRRDLEEKLRNN